MTTQQAISKFFRRLEAWPVEPDGHNFTQAQIKAICEVIAEQGYSLWHAQSVALNQYPCPCMDCEHGRAPGTPNKCDFRWPDWHPNSWSKA